MHVWLQPVAQPCKRVSDIVENNGYHDVQIYGKPITQALCSSLSTCDISRWKPQAQRSFAPSYGPASLSQQLSPSEATQLTDGESVCDNVIPDGSLSGCR